MISYIKYLPPSHLLLSALTLRLLHPKHIFGITTLGDLVLYTDLPPDNLHFYHSFGH